MMSYHATWPIGCGGPGHPVLLSCRPASEPLHAFGKSILTPGPVLGAGAVIGNESEVAPLCGPHAPGLEPEC